MDALDGFEDKGEEVIIGVHSLGTGETGNDNIGSPSYQAALIRRNVLEIQHLLKDVDQEVSGEVQDRIGKIMSSMRTIGLAEAREEMLHQDRVRGR